MKGMRFEACLTLKWDGMAVRANWMHRQGINGRSCQFLKFSTSKISITYKDGEQ